jgi:hypothetical protein
MARRPLSALEIIFNHGLGLCAAHSTSRALAQCAGPAGKRAVDPWTQVDGASTRKDGWPRPPAQSCESAGRCGDVEMAGAERPAVHRGRCRGAARQRMRWSRQPSQEPGGTHPPTPDLRCFDLGLARAKCPSRGRLSAVSSNSAALSAQMRSGLRNRPQRPWISRRSLYTLRLPLRLSTSGSAGRSLCPAAVPFPLRYPRLQHQKGGAPVPGGPN